MAEYFLPHRHRRAKRRKESQHKPPPAPTAKTTPPPHEHTATTSPDNNDNTTTARTTTQPQQPTTAHNRNRNLKETRQIRGMTDAVNCRSSGTRICFNIVVSSRTQVDRRRASPNAEKREQQTQWNATDRDAERTGEDARQSRKTNWEPLTPEQAHRKCVTESPR